MSMKKSILVIDTPERCVDCVCFPLCSLEYGLLYGEVLKAKSKPIKKICKLKPMPEKKDEHVKLDSWELTDIYNAEHRGYNNAINDILGGNDDE